MAGGPARDALLGFAVGDALAVAADGLSPVALRRRHGFLRRMVGGGLHDLPPGRGSSLSEILRRVSQTLVRCGGFDGEAIVEGLRPLVAPQPPPGLPAAWVARLVGSTSRIDGASSSHVFALALPLALRSGVSDDEALATTSALLGRLGISVAATPVLSWVALLRGGGRRGRQGEGGPSIGGAPSGRAHDALGRAEDALRRSATLGEALLRLVNQGGACAGACALAGALGALRWGATTIPEDWSEPLEARDWVRDVAPLL